MSHFQPGADTAAAARAPGSTASADREDPFGRQLLGPEFSDSSPVATDPPVTKKTSSPASGTSASSLRTNYSFLDKWYGTSELQKFARDMPEQAHAIGLTLGDYGTASNHVGTRGAGGGATPVDHAAQMRRASVTHDASLLQARGVHVPRQTAVQAALDASRDASVPTMPMACDPPSASASTGTRSNTGGSPSTMPQHAFDPSSLTHDTSSLHFAASAARPTSSSSSTDGHTFGSDAGGGILRLSSPRSPSPSHGGATYLREQLSSQSTTLPMLPSSSTVGVSMSSPSDSALASASCGRSRTRPKRTIHDVYGGDGIDDRAADSPTRSKSAKSPSVGPSRLRLDVPIELQMALKEKPEVAERLLANNPEFAVRLFDDFPHFARRIRLENPELTYRLCAHHPRLMSKLMQSAVSEASALQPKQEPHSDQSTSSHSNSHSYDPSRFNLSPPLTSSNHSRSFPPPGHHTSSSLPSAAPSAQRHAHTLNGQSFSQSQSQLRLPNTGGSLGADQFASTRAHEHARTPPAAAGRHSHQAQAPRPAYLNLKLDELKSLSHNDLVNLVSTLQQQEKNLRSQVNHEELPSTGGHVVPHADQLRDYFRRSQAAQGFLDATGAGAASAAAEQFASMQSMKPPPSDDSSGASPRAPVPAPVATDSRGGNGLSNRGIFPSHTYEHQSSSSAPSSSLPNLGALHDAGIGGPPRPGPPHMRPVTAPDDPSWTQGHHMSKVEAVEYLLNARGMHLDSGLRRSLASGDNAAQTPDQARHNVDLQRALALFHASPPSGADHTTAGMQSPQSDFGDIPSMKGDGLPGAAGGACVSSPCGVPPQSQAGAADGAGGPFTGTAQEEGKPKNRKTKRVCENCFYAKVACDCQRPCARCLRLRKERCVDRPLVKRAKYKSKIGSSVVPFLPVKYLADFGLPSDALDHIDLKTIYSVDDMETHLKIVKAGTINAYKAMAEELKPFPERVKLAIRYHVDYLNATNTPLERDMIKELKEVCGLPEDCVIPDNPTRYLKISGLADDTGLHFPSSIKKDMNSRCGIARSLLKKDDTGREVRLFDYNSRLREMLGLSKAQMIKEFVYARCRFFHADDWEDIIRDTLTLYTTAWKNLGNFGSTPLLTASTEAKSDSGGSTPMTDDDGDPMTDDAPPPAASAPSSSPLPSSSQAAAAPSSASSDSGSGPSRNRGAITKIHRMLTKAGKSVPVIFLRFHGRPLVPGEESFTSILVPIAYPN